MVGRKPSRVFRQNIENRVILSKDGNVTHLDAKCIANPQSDGEGAGLGSMGAAKPVSSDTHAKGRRQDAPTRNGTRHDATHLAERPPNWGRGLKVG
jgi:hypothetical protein